MAEPTNDGRYEENRHISPFASWMLVALLCVATMAWGVGVYLLVPDAPRRWDYNALPSAPGQSIYSADRTPRPDTTPPQIVPLPESRPVPRTKGEAVPK